MFIRLNRLYFFSDFQKSDLQNFTKEDWNEQHETQ
jgi:hypothetical protein